MEPLPQKLIGLGRRTLMLLLCLSPTLGLGCVSTEEFFASEDGPPKGKPCQLAATWDREVQYAPDSLHNGEMMPGLTGRIYLFGPKGGDPLEADGKMTIDLYDDTPVLSGGLPVRIEQWQFDSVTLKKMMFRDRIGWGYTMFLPWGSHRPDITHVRLMTRFDPEKGMPLFAPGNQMTVERADPTRPQTQIRTGSAVVPVSANKPAP